MEKTKAMERLEELNTKGCLWIYILRILKDGPSHGYTVRSAIHDRFGFRPGTVTAYKVLYDLNRAGLVVKSPQGRKKVYTITKRGRKELSKALNFYRGRANALQ